MTRSAAALAALLASSTASAREVSGVKVPDTVESGGVTLKLNGAGIRTRTFLKVKVYLGALYLPVPASDPAAILAAGAPWVVRMHFLRDVDRKSMLDAYREGFEKNSREKLPEILPLFDRVAPAIADVKEGQVMVVSYRPGAGTTVGVEGGPQATVEGKVLADGLLGNWLGKEPADSDLKEAMLGRP
ncbi:MAG TPA: chalcone isomerase family protein [Anaeromyxobacteraceae bacterium]|nr:chalcone isomerase family protein [Anaeromyxobacteraceae bacterium]